MTTKTVKCAACKGTGRIPDQKAIGEEMKALRISKGVSLRGLSESMTPKRSSSYIMDLERGNRKWSIDLITKYQNALK